MAGFITEIQSEDLLVQRPRQNLVRLSLKSSSGSQGLKGDTGISGTAGSKGDTGSSSPGSGTIDETLIWFGL